jgi:hypothetical protein
MSASYAVPSHSDFYVNLLMQEWRLDEQSAEFQARVRTVLLELVASCQLVLRREPRLEVMVVESRTVGLANLGVQAYYYTVAQEQNVVLQPKPETEVLLVFSEEFEKQAAALAEDELRHHIGHTLRYLSNPQARNDCRDAEAEWRACQPIDAPRADTKASATARKMILDCQQSLRIRKGQRREDRETGPVARPEDPLESIRQSLKDWDCVCKGCMDLRADSLMEVSGFDIQRLQVKPTDDAESIDIMRACLEEFAEEVDLEDFLQGSVRPAGVLLLFRSADPHENAKLYELSTELSEHLSRNLRIQ